MWCTTSTWWIGVFVANRRDTEVKTVGEWRLPLDVLEREKGKSHVRGDVGRVQVERVVLGEYEDAVGGRVKGDEHGGTCQLASRDDTKPTEESEITA